MGRFGGRILESVWSVTNKFRNLLVNHHSLVFAYPFQMWFSFGRFHLFNYYVSILLYVFVSLIILFYMLINAIIPEPLKPLVDCLNQHEEELSLTDSQVYFDFPVYKELDEGILVAQAMVISRSHGVLIFKVANETVEEDFNADLEELTEDLNRLYTSVFTRIMRNEKLKTGRSKTLVSISTIIYAPYLPNPARHHSGEERDEVFINYTEKQLLDCLVHIQGDSIELSEPHFNELLSSIEGSKGLIVPNKREEDSEGTKAFAANKAEREIMLFDSKQKTAYLSPIVGVSRIRGLAGSGKTVILCMKAALLHLREPNAIVLYTFYTKSLYQHVRRLITRFYRQYNDQDPNWDKVQVRHAWGSNSLEGVYSHACDMNSVPKMSFEQARQFQPQSPFEHVCNDFITKAPHPERVYDYVLIDEGQDFPTSFIRMCLSLVKEDRILFAYDDLQTIFQHHAPTSAEIFGTNPDGSPRVRFVEDRVLSKCYRNPREILVVAHALGFGIYGKTIAQMIDNADYWKDIGYTITEGELVPGSNLSILRPEENSLQSISSAYSIQEIIRYSIYPKLADEVKGVCECIYDDIYNQHLHPEDVLVLTADDRNAQTYLNEIESCLASSYDIKTNNIHADKYSVGNFQEKDRVTLSTIHKAKGNESYSVYIVGIDALVASGKSYRARNLLFTAMTRAKGWVRLSGMGDRAKPWINEIECALSNFPYLRFKYPTEEDIKVMKRDMEEAAIKENRHKRLIDDLLTEMTPEEAKLLIEEHDKSK